MLNSVVSKVASSAGNEVIAYQVPGTKVLANVSIVIANIGVTPATVKMGITSGGTIANDDRVEDGVTLAANNGVLRRTNVLMGPNEKIIIQSNSSNLAIRTYGLEQQ